ncbi:SacI homology domain-containing protein [Xylogone sp. PMI_703]|nr:SacI homology domain-containing protein [Xylogone sp. PMI_703]
MTSPLSMDVKDDDDDEYHLPKFPPLHTSDHEDAAPKRQETEQAAFADVRDDKESPVYKPIERSGTQKSEQKQQDETDSDEDEQTGCIMRKFFLYETASQFYIVGADILDEKFRILQIDRGTEAGDLSIVEDPKIYTKAEMRQRLDKIEYGNKSSHGPKLKCSMWGLLGFIRFTGTYYMLLVTKRSQVAVIGGHYVYQIDGTELIPLNTTLNSRFKQDARNTEEARFLGILNNLDLTRSFYFSYSYDITRTLQHNIIAEREALEQGVPYPHPSNHNSMFVWNSYLLEPAAVLQDKYDWCLPIIHGYIDQAALSVYGRTVHITIIARRSRFFAGARFLKRGANDLGYVANDVETEQIVSDMLTTSFHAPGPVLFANPNYTSYVQHRGSIPLYWTQDNTGVTPKPPIELNLVDPFYGAAALHFDNLFERYGSKIYVLNLVKARERTPRESKLLHEFTNAINYLNQFLPDENKIIHKAFDMSRAAKSRDQDVIGILENIAEEVVNMTGFFQNGDSKTSMPTIQNGVTRTNCIDCLDRTNAAQFVIGKRALCHQLHALNVIADPSIDYDTDAINLFTHMFHDHGDTIAIQYGGSQLVNTMETYRKINQWSSHSRDMVESFKRYYNNSFLDGQRQEAYNLFLGNYIFTQGQPMLWDLATDYYLHHADPRGWALKPRRSYLQWYTPENLKAPSPPPPVRLHGRMKYQSLSYFDKYWTEYYKPLAISSLQKIFSYMGKMNSTLRYIPIRPMQEGRYDLSPFTVRTDMYQDVSDKRKGKKEIAAARPNKDVEDDSTSTKSGVPSNSTKRMTIRWLQPIHEKEAGLNGIAQQIIPEHGELPKGKLTAIDKSKAAQWTFTQVVANSLNPAVSEQEAEDYISYVSHPQTLPLVTSDETPSSKIAAEYFYYINEGWQDASAVDTVSVPEEDLTDYETFVTVGRNPLTVMDEDYGKKRYKAYKKWLLGKSLFKTQPVD